MTDAPNIPEYSVGELAFALRRTLEDAYGYVRVRGEISGFKRHGSGHCYFTLKDAQANLDAVCWRSSAGRIRFKPEDGLEVIASGRITTYASRSKYQLMVESMTPAGVGALMALLEERKKKLEAEGLFAAERKRALPFLPDVIGIVTSPTGAVIRDVLHRLAERFPRRVLLWPVVVQGELAAGQIAAAIRGFNALMPGGPVPRPDVLIVARGGGSLEDLWAFNEEDVVRAAAASAIPLISAVGHETDTTLIDYAADRRAPTPTAAAEIAVPVRLELVQRVQQLDLRLVHGVDRELKTLGQQVTGLGRGLPDPQSLLAQATQRLDDLGERLPRALLLCADGAGHRLNRQGDRLDLARKTLMREPEAQLERAATRLTLEPVQRRLPECTRLLAGLGERSAHAAGRRLHEAAQRLDGLACRLESVSHASVLERGFALVRDGDGHLVRSAQAGRRAGSLELEFLDGKVRAVPAEPRRRPARNLREPAEQGQLL